MAIELLEMTTAEFLDFINKYPHLGGITVMEHDDVSSSVDDLRVGDVCLYYDYCTDDCDRDEESAFCEWAFGSDVHDFGVLGVIDQFMANQGYKEVDTVDGSGGGLHYGIVQYRKAQQI
jgi:hypothetical protein